ncbi:MAG TPA: hypothetical protein PLK31_06045, partial [Chloroflexota bacterium]|nr:hypothetical protein [Chloroflexota bacterium]
KTKLITLSIVLLFSLLAKVGHAQKADVQAQTFNEGKCYPLDIVILLDESQSMYERNDRDGRRFDAIGTIIDYLGNHAVFLCREEGIQHRVSVVGFGDQAAAALKGNDNNYEDDIVIFLESTVIPNQTMSDRDIKEATSIWDSQRNEITIENPQTSLGATDHRSAFRAALDVLSQWESDPLGQTPRRKAVILLTDGGSCVRNLGCNDSSLYRADANALNSTAQTLMAELVEFLKQTGDQFPFYGSSDPESVFITAVFLSRDINMESLGTSERWRQIALDHGGDLFPVESSTSLVATVNDALDPISGSGRTPVECGSPVWVRPYLDNVVIFSAYPLVDNPSERAVVVIMDPADNNLYGISGGVPITGSISTENMKYQSYRGNETYIFNAPIPGAYQVFVGDTADCTDALSIKVDTASISSAVISPVTGLILPTVEGAPYYSSHVNGIFALTIEDANGQPLEENPNYPLTVTAVVHNDDPDYEKTYTLAQIGDGYYESDFIETPSPGTYRWEVMVTVPHPDPKEGPIIKLTPENNQGRFTASPVELLSFTIETPSNNDVSALNRVQGISQIPNPLTIAVKVVDTAGDVDVTTIFDDWSNLFSAQLTDGTRILETIDLELDPTTKNRFIGQFSNGSIDNLIQSGTHVVNVRANWGGAVNYDELAYTPALENASVVVEQHEIKPLQLELNPPQEASIHQRDTLLRMFLKQNALQPFPVSVRVVDPLNENSPIFLNEVLNGAAGFDVVVETPSGITQTITLAESNNVAEQLLVGSGGELLDESGEYTLSIRVNDDQLLEEYAWAQTSYEATFTREDSTYTNPTTWTGVQAVMLIIWLIYIFSGGPTGSLVIVDTGTKKELVTLKLRKHRRVNKFKRSVFKNVGIKQITAKKGYDNLVSVHVKQTDGHESPLDNMEPEDNFDVGENGNIRYVNDLAPVPSYDD